MKLLFFLRDLLRPISVTAITLFLLFIAQPLVAQYKEDVPDMVDQAVVEEPKLPKSEPLAIPKRLKDGKVHPFRAPNKLYGCILNDSIVIPFEYEELELLSSNLVRAKKQGIWGLLNTKGEMVLPFEYVDLRASKKETFLANKNRKYGLISAQNKVLVPLEYSSIDYINDSIVMFKRPSQQLFVRVISAHEVAEVATWAYEFVERLGNNDNLNYFAARKNGKTGIVDFENKQILPFDYEKILYFKGNLITFGTATHSGLVNFQNQIRIPAEKYRSLNLTPDPNLFLATDERYFYGLVDSMGVVKIPFLYNYCWVIEGSVYAKCKKTGKPFALWTTAGKQLTEELYEDILFFKQIPGILFGKLPDLQKYQMLDAQDKVISRHLLEDISYYDNGFDGTLGGKRAFFDVNGRQLTDFVYSATSSFNNAGEADKAAQKVGLPQGFRLICRAVNPAGQWVYIDDKGNEYEMKR